MILNEEKECWHYLTVKNLLVLLTSKTNGDFCCLNCCHFFRIDNKFKFHKN